MKTKDKKLIIFRGWNPRIEQREFDLWDFTFDLCNAFDRVYECNVGGATNVVHTMYGAMAEAEETCKMHVASDPDHTCRLMFDGCNMTDTTIEVPITLFVKIVGYTLADSLAHVKLAECLREEDFLPFAAQEEKAS